MTKLLIALVLNTIMTVVFAEPVFRFDSTKQGDNSKSKTEEAPPRPAYFDAYKNVNKGVSRPPGETKNTGEVSQGSNSTAPVQSDKQVPSGLTEESRQMIQDKLKSIDPVLLQKAQEQLKNYSSPSNQ